MRHPSSADPDRAKAPDVHEIERRFRTPAVRAVRPLVLGGIKALGLVRGYTWRAEGLATLDTIDLPVIFAANHCSHADTAAILGSLPGPIRRRTCVAAALDVFGPASNGVTTLKGLRRECLQIVVAAGFHAFAFDRHGPPHRSLRTAVDLVRNGWSLLLYPEGTRSRNGEIGRFKPGVGVLARATGRPVVPVRVAGGRNVLPCGATIPRAGEIVTSFGPWIAPFEGESAREFTARIRTGIISLEPRREDVHGMASSVAPCPKFAAVPPAAAGDVKRSA